MLSEVLDTPKTNLENGCPIKETTIEKLALKVKSPKEYKVKLVERIEIRDFLQKWHYSKNINGLRSTYCFALYNNVDGVDIIIGAMIYGKMGMANAWKKYGECEDDVIELRRLAMIDSTCRNSESYFIGQTIKWIKNNTSVKTIVSYVDAYYGHVVIIYKASNFKLIGKTQSGRVIKYGDRLYHDKTIRTKYKGELKPFAKRIKDALEDGEAEYIKTPPKNIYIYELNRRTKND